MNVTADQLREVTEKVWTSFVDSGIRTTEAHEPADHEVLFITGCIQITGTWVGAVTVCSSPALARRLAAAMFGSEPGEVADDEVKDALGEVANMVGGNVKTLLGGSCQLSLPAVADGPVRIPHAQLVVRVQFDCEGGSLIVSVLEMQGKGITCD